LFLLSLLIGLIIATLVWCAASTLIAYAIIHAEQKFPRMAESKVTIAGEVVACLTLVLACLGLAFWIAKALSAR